MKNIKQLRDYHLNHTTHSGEPFFPKTTIEGVEGLEDSAIPKREPNKDKFYIENNDGTKEQLVTDKNINSFLPKGTVNEVLWQELKDLRDNGQLIPGNLYRITDYQCTTTQEDTQSAGHQFDIVLLALSENKLAEEGWAMMNESNIYDVTFNGGMTKKCYIFKTSDAYCNVVLLDTMLGYADLGLGQGDDIEITSEEDKTAIASIPYIDFNEENVQYNYFQNSNLSAWKVWYCLDNYTIRFAWADDSVDESNPAYVMIEDASTSPYIRNTSADANNLFAWTNNEMIVSETWWTESETPQTGDDVYDNEGVIYGKVSITSYTPAHEGTGLPNGRGIIYRLIDEFNNDIKYDFKNIQFKRKLTNGRYDANGDETWCYTLNLWHNNVCHDASIVGNTLPDNEGYIKGVYDNKFGHATASDLGTYGVSTFAFVLGNNVTLSFIDFGYGGIYSNTFGDGSYNNTIGNGFKNNVIGNRFANNIIGNDFFGNIVGNFFIGITGVNDISYKNYGNNGVELATKNDI